jgi:hypothetical protein
MADDFSEIRWNHPSIRLNSPHIHPAVDYYGPLQGSNRNSPNLQ